MKHVFSRLAAVTLGLMLLAGCIRIVPLAPREEAEQTVLDAICSSVYVDPDADEGEEIAQFIFVGDTLLCEVTETLAAYYAEEIIPDDPSALFAPAADGAPIPVTLRQFSGFSMFGEYWGDGARLQMQLTDDGIVFRTENGAEFRRTRSDGTPPPRTTDARQSEIEARLGARMSPMSSAAHGPAAKATSSGSSSSGRTTASGVSIASRSTRSGCTSGRAGSTRRAPCAVWRAVSDGRTSPLKAPGHGS